MKTTIATLLLLALMPLIALSQNKTDQNSNAPKNEPLKSRLFGEIMHTDDPDSVVMYLNIFLKKYPNSLKEYKYRPDVIYGIVADKMALHSKWSEYEKYRLKLSDEFGSELNFRIAGGPLQTNNYLLAEKFCLRSLSAYVKINKINFPIRSGPYPDTSKLKGYESRAFLYAQITYKNNQEHLGLPYAYQAATIANNTASDEYALYVKLLAKTAEPNAVLAVMEKQYRDGNLNDDEFPTIIANLYFKIHKNSENFNTYYQSLHDQLMDTTRKIIIKNKISMVAPDFNLLDLKGKAVKLSDFKGKIVVLDFWATWCGVCKRAFPAMQKMIEKYKANDKVVFLFIDTQEEFSYQKQKTNVVNYITDNKYDFNVLYDDKNGSEVAASYLIEGLPTKFVIDKHGNIAFKDIGFGSSDEVMIDDLSAMIDLSI